MGAFSKSINGMAFGPWSDSFVQAVLAYSITIGLSASTGKRLREVQLVDNAFEGPFQFCEEKWVFVSPQPMVSGMESPSNLSIE